MKSISTADLDLMKAKGDATNRGKKNNWACKAYNEWRESTLDANSSDSLEDIALSDLMKLQTLVQDKFFNSLCKFILEIRKMNGGDYPPHTV